MGPRPQDITRRSLLGSAIAVAAVAVTGTTAAAVAPAGAESEVSLPWREFARTPFTHPQIPYIGRAGFRGGKARFPRRPVVADVTECGAVADGTTDVVRPRNLYEAQRELWSGPLR